MGVPRSQHAGELAIMQKYAKAVRLKYVKALEPYSATGKSAKSIQEVVTPTSFQIVGGYWLFYTDQGRGSRKSTQDMGFFDAIKDWIVKKDSFSLTTKQSLDTAARRLQYLINKSGTKGHGTSRRIFDDVNIESEIFALSDRLGESWLTQLVDGIGVRARLQSNFVKVTIKH